jgi:hypothetical protein
MEPRIEYNVEKMFDRGPKYGFLEVQVTFEEKAPPGSTKGVGFAQVVVSLAKAEVGSKSFEEIRVMALSKAVSFMEECVRASAKR